MTKLSKYKADMRGELYTYNVRKTNARYVHVRRECIMNQNALSDLTSHNIRFTTLTLLDKVESAYV